MFEQNLKNEIFQATVDCHNYGETELVNLLTKLANVSNYYNAENLVKQIEFASATATNGDAKIVVEIVLEKVNGVFDAMFNAMFNTGYYDTPFDPDAQIPEDAYFDDMPHPELDLMPDGCQDTFDRWHS